jgi:HAL2 family 3'(2'),5'-bisphosphate nucleotidase
MQARLPAKMSFCSYAGWWLVMLASLRDVALNLVVQATRIGRSVQTAIALQKWDKQDRSPVTVADLAIQALVSAGLREAFPEIPLMGEESADELRTEAMAPLVAQIVEQVRQVAGDKVSPEFVLEAIDRGREPLDLGGRYWVLDPVDGTKGFLRREQYAIALALMEAGRPVLGILACPNLPGRVQGPVDPDAPLGHVYTAISGEGACEVPLLAGDVAGTARPIRVAAAGSAAATRWVERVESSDRNKDVSSLIAEAAGVSEAPMRLDSQAKYAVVARGEAALYLRHTLDPAYREMVWDHAGGVLVIEEAGGRVTDLAGRPLDFTHGRRLERNRGIIATGAGLHERVVEAVGAHLTPEALLV